MDRLPCFHHDARTTPTGKAADRGDARADLPNCSDGPMIDPMTIGTVKRPSAGRAPPPRAKRSSAPPTRPGRRHDPREPRTTRGHREHSGARDPPPPGNCRAPEDCDLGLEQGRDRAPTPRCRRAAHPRPHRHLPRRVRLSRRTRCRSSRRRPPRHRSALPDHSRTTPRHLRRLARPPHQRRALPRSARRQPHPTPTVHRHRAHQRGLLRGTRQRPPEGAFTRRQLARAARCQGPVPPLRIRPINAFATPPPPPTADGDPDASRTRSRPVGYETTHRSARYRPRP